MPPDTLLLAYVVSLLAGVGALALYSELRRKRFEPTPSEDRIFRCGQCSFVYTDDAEVDLSRCPQCGTANESIQF
jgi:predicted Zn-ribbon and HTH transcriptional regulator